MPFSVACLGEELAFLLNNSYGLFLSRGSIWSPCCSNTCALTHVPYRPHTMRIMCLYASTIDLWLQCNTTLWHPGKGEGGANSGRSHKCLGVCGKGRREEGGGRLYECEREREGGGRKEVNCVSVRERGGILGDSLNVWMCVAKEGGRREIV